MPKIFITTNPVMALFGRSRTTGLVVDNGDSVTHTVPIIEGIMQRHEIEKSNKYGGNAMTKYLAEIIQGLTGQKLVDDSLFNSIQEMKHKYCYVAANYEEAEQKALSSVKHDK